jgi:hypothetical protein
VKLSAEQSSFWDFILGEYYLKNKNISAAIEAYKRCLKREQDSTELDDWFINRTKRKIHELLNENVLPKRNLDINNGE